MLELGKSSSDNYVSDRKPMGKEDTAIDMSEWEKRAMSEWEKREILPAEEDLRGAFMKRAQDKELDMYQVVSVWPTKYNYIRACMCALIQLVILPLVIVKIMTDKDSKGICAMSPVSSNWESKICASIFCMYLNFIFWRFYREIVDDTLMGKMGEGLMAGFANAWYIAGMYLNTISLFFTSAGSIVVIYNSDTPLDIILNALAIAFINDVDDLIVTKGDCREVESKMKWEKDSEKALPKFLDLLDYFVIWVPFFATGLGLLAAPVWIGICY